MLWEIEPDYLAMFLTSTRVGQDPPEGFRRARKSAFAKNFGLLTLYLQSLTRHPYRQPVVTVLLMRRDNDNFA
jgi:hypothetical protein